MHTATALAAHATAFWAFVFLVAPPAVTVGAWLATYSLGAGMLLLVALRTATTSESWPAVRLFLYSLLLALIFFGADQALTVLGTSVKPRQPLPAFLGGLELYYLLVPGVAAVALGQLVASIYASSQRTRQRSRAASGEA